MKKKEIESLLLSGEDFAERHIGPRNYEISEMLGTLEVEALSTLVEKAIPSEILTQRELEIPSKGGERESLEYLRELAGKNKRYRSFIGAGFYNTFTPPVIVRNILENPGWYTQYTPYQAEISQGRLEALMIFQTMVADLTGLEVANASLLDEATAAAEAMTMSVAISRGKRNSFAVAADCHPQTLSVLQTRAWAKGIQLNIVSNFSSYDWENADDLAGILVQYPTTDGRLLDFEELVEKAHQKGALVIAATDLLALTLFKSPGEWGADIAVGSTQRFGLPLGYGGPHAGFLASKKKFVRSIPGRIVGASRDKRGNLALRLALQTREQHIRRERATSNICTAQVLPAILSAMYAVYHGPDGLKKIAQRIHALTAILEQGLQKLGYSKEYSDPYFDTLRIKTTSAEMAEILKRAEEKRLNFRRYQNDTLGISLDETCDLSTVSDILECFSSKGSLPFEVGELIEDGIGEIPEKFERKTPFLTHAVFNTYHSETDMMRFLKRLQEKDLSLVDSMIPLGSCTMKLNAAAEMFPITWPEFTDIHPFAPPEQAEGYLQMIGELGEWLKEITGLDAVSFQPNAGSQGEYTGLLVIKAYHQSRNDEKRVVCLIPQSAHGTNPASAVMAGYRVVPVKCDEMGNIDIQDLREKAEKYSDELGAIMITYPSTHGVFEEGIQEICQIVHRHGGQVYLDGANMNAMVGLVRPGELGVDVCHLNLHKTFSIPHGGGGPGMGPIAVASHLTPFLPGHPWREGKTSLSLGAIAAAPFGSPNILPISWMYIAMMGGRGLKRASQVAILNANYMAKKLSSHYKIVYTGKNNSVAHEFIVDFRPFRQTAGIEVVDVAKRLMDYGFHAPTMSWPIHGTLMIEPTESEPKAELDRFCDALISIREEIRKIEEGIWPKDDNPLKNAPHTLEMFLDPEWTHPYSKREAAFPKEWVTEHKFWPAVARIDEAYGDRHLLTSLNELLPENSKV